MQLRFATGLTSEEYVSRQAWRDATLSSCPLHPRGGCAFARHGTYERVTPPGARIARWYCPQGHCSFSLLPDCLAAKLPGTLAELERVVAEVEQAVGLEAAADRLRSDPIELAGAIRWVRRRVTLVRLTLTILIGLLPEHFAGTEARVNAFRQLLATDCALVRLRDIAAPFLATLPPPLGFGPRPTAALRSRNASQHRTGPDPPPLLA